MSALSIQPTFPIFTDTDGSPLENGYIWIGTVNLPAQTNPIAVYWDAALTIPAALPVRTRGGYPVNAGTPARLYVGSDYSILVQNKNGSMVYSAPVATERYGGGIINAADVVYDPAGTGAVATTVQAKLRETVSVKDFGAVGDGVTDDTAAFKAAIGAYGDNKNIYIPEGTYLIKESLFLGLYKKLYGDSSSTVLIRFDPPVAGDTDCIVGDAFTQVQGLSIIKLAAFPCQGLVSYTPTVSNGWRNGSVRDVVITDFDVAIGSTQGLTQGLMFQNVYERVRTYNATTALQMGSGSNANTFLNCEFWNSGTAVHLNNVTTQTFIGCGFENSTTFDFVVESSYNIEFETCYFEPARGGTFDNSTGTFDNCHSTDFVNDPNLQFITYSNNSVISVNDFTDYNFAGHSAATQWYARSGDGTGYAEKSNLLVRTGTEKADGIKVAPPYISGSGTNMSLANGATQTIVSLAGAKSGLYQVYAIIRASGSPVNYSSFGVVSWDTTGAQFIAGNNGAPFQISISGTDVIVTNGIGSAALNVDYGYLRIGPL